MTTASSARDLQPATANPPVAANESMLSLDDDQFLSRLPSIGAQAALGILLSVFGMSYAVAQSIDQDMTIGANTQATRDRVVAELRQARADGAIKGWSPVLVEMPYKAPLKGRRFESFTTRHAEHSSIQIESSNTRAGQ